MKIPFSPERESNEVPRGFHIEGWGEGGREKKVSTSFQTSLRGLVGCFVEQITGRPTLKVG